MFTTKRSFMETVLRAAPDGATGTEGDEKPAAAVAAVVDTPVDTTEGAAPAPAEVPVEEPAPAAPNLAPDWAKRRIDGLTANWRGTQDELAAERQRVKALEASIEELQKSNPEALKGLNDTEIERRATKLADERIAQKAWNDSCEKIYNDGKAQFDGKSGPTFDEALKEYAKIGGLPIPLIAAALETDAPHEVLYALAQDLNEASRVLNLAPAKQAITLDRLANKIMAERDVDKKSAVSKAPAPATPIKGASTAEFDPESASVAEWMAWREKQVEQNRKSGKTMW